MDGAGTDDDEETVVALLDNFDGLIATLTDGFDCAFGLEEFVRARFVWLWLWIGGGGEKGKGKKNDSRRGFQFGGIEAGEEGRSRGLHRQLEINSI